MPHIGTQIPSAAPLVLIVENDVDSREMYALSLTLSQFRVAEAGGGGEALEMARALAPDAIVTDLALTDGGGLDLVARLKADTPTSQIPIIVLTASALEEQRRSAFGAGCDLFLTKPCDPDALASAIRLVLRG